MILQARGNVGTLLAGHFYSRGPLDEYDSLSLYGLAPQKRGVPHGMTGRVEGSAGYLFCKNGFTAIPLWGWSYYHQNLFTKTLCSTTKAVIRGESYDIRAETKQTLQTNWTGPFVGGDLLWGCDSRLALFGSLKFHFDKFRAVAKKEQSVSTIESENTSTHLKKNTLSYTLEGGINGRITDCLSLIFSIDHTHLFQNDLLNYHSTNFKLGLTKTF